MTGKAKHHARDGRSCRDHRRAVALAAAWLALMPAPSQAQLAEPFFANKPITFTVAFNPGGTYDTYARLAARHLPKHIPGQPAIVVRNMQGANSVRGATHLATQAPRDGTAIGMISQAIALKKVLEEPAVRIDVGAFGWIGRITSAVEATIVWHTSPTKTLADATRRETVLAGTSVLGTPDTNPRLMNNFAGTKFKVVNGYPGAGATMLAMERGEVEGAYTGLETLLSSKKDWLAEKKVSVLVQYSNERHRLFPQVPAMTEFGRTAEDKQILSLYGATAEIGISLITPPDVPAERLAILRRAFDAMVADPEFLADAKARQMEVEPARGEALQKMIAAMLGVPPEIAKRAATARE
jgi:tripartite-type tricarboxylate transporter receptor subunit TctC